MHVVSVNVGLPSEVEWKGRKVLTGIFKSPVHARVPVRRLNIDGDGQADLTVHGGPDKAVYAYPSERYGPWAGRLGYELSPGNFGENLTTQGLLEDAVHIGDEFRVGTARLAAFSHQGVREPLRWAIRPHYAPIMAQRGFDDPVGHPPTRLGLVDPPAYLLLRAPGRLRGAARSRDLVPEVHPRPRS